MNITELKELAEKATPGPWKSRKGFHDGTAEIFAPDKDIKPPFYPTELASVEAYKKQGKANAKFIAAANPAEILELIAKLEDAKGEIRALRATEAGLRGRLAAVEADRAQRVPDWNSFEKAVQEYVEDYEMVGETEDGRDACYAPNEGEKALLLDAFMGFDFSPWLLASTPAPEQWAQRVPDGWALVKSPITEEMHIAAAKVLTRASGLDGTPQRVLDSLLASTPAQPAQQEPDCPRCKGSVEDPEGYFDQSRGPDGDTHDGPCRDCAGTGAAPQPVERKPMTEAVIRERARLHLQAERSYRGLWDEGTELASRVLELGFIEGAKAAERHHHIRE